MTLIAVASSAVEPAPPGAPAPTPALAPGAALDGAAGPGLGAPPAGTFTDEVATFDGRRLCVSYADEPIVDLQRGAVAGHWVQPRLSYPDADDALTAQDRLALLASDMERVDALTVSRTVTRLKAGGGFPILSISFLTASSQRARSKLLGGSSDVKELLRAHVIWLLTDLPDGAPAGRLIEVASLMRPFGRAVFAKTRLTGIAVKAARDAGIGGLMIEPQRPAANDVDAAIWLLQAGRLARRAAPALIAPDLSSKALFGMAAEAGFTHATVAAAPPGGAGTAG